MQSALKLKVSKCTHICCIPDHHEVGCCWYGGGRGALTSALVTIPFTLHCQHTLTECEVIRENVCMCVVWAAITARQ